MDSNLIMYLIGTNVVAVLTGWVVKSFLNSRKNESEFIIEQKSLNKHFCQHIEDQKEFNRKFYEYKETHQEQGNQFRQTIITKIDELKNSITYLTDMIKKDILDHDKRIDALEKKTQSLPSV